MKFKIILIIGSIFLFEKLNSQPNWPLTKSNTTLQVAIPSEFGTPIKQPLSVDGWEDGVYISRNGLNLYCSYLPADALSWTLNGAPCIFAPYQKGPTYGMDFTTTPTTTCPTWLHGDILISSRTSTSVAFPSWTLSNINGPLFTEGAPQFVMLNNTVSDLVVYTKNQNPHDIYIINNSTTNPSTVSAVVLPSPVSASTTEDNPHIERLSASQLVLFFDSYNRVGGVGGIDIWYTISNDNGISWNNPQQVSTINTLQDEHQPHLYKDNLNQWWLYYTGPDTSGKTAIYRAKQTILNDWDSWGIKQLVLGPGNAAGIGEPTLTQNGDLSFVVVYQDANGTATDKFDADPWFLPHSTITGLQNNASDLIISVYPNPSSDKLTIMLPTNNETKKILIYNSIGILVRDVEIEAKTTIDISDLSEGVYFITNKENFIQANKFIKLN